MLKNNILNQNSNIKDQNQTKNSKTKHKHRTFYQNLKQNEIFKF